MEAWIPPGCLEELILCKPKGRTVAPATTFSLHHSDGYSWQPRQQVPSETSPFIADGDGGDRGMLGPEWESQDTAEPPVLGMAGGLGTWFVSHRDTNRPVSRQEKAEAVLMGGAVLITSQLLHFLRQSAATPRPPTEVTSDGQHPWCPRGRQ